VGLRQVLRHVGQAESGQRRIEHLVGAVEDELAFDTTYPSAGAYRLFVQFSYEGRIHTAAFTQRVSP
jgi:hypothetical protein